MAHADKLIFSIAMLLMLSTGMPFYDDLQGYDSVVNPTFTSNYTYNATGFSNIFQIASDSVRSVFLEFTEVPAADGVAVLNINTSKIKIVGAFNAGFVIHSASKLALYSDNNIGFAFLTNQTSDNNKLTATSGYIAKFYVTAVSGTSTINSELRRCTNINSLDTCGSLLASGTTTLPNASMTSVAGFGYAYFNQSASFNVSKDTNNNIAVFLNGVQLLSYADNIYSSGYISIINKQKTSQVLYLDNISVIGDIYVSSPYGMMYPVSYPELLPNNYSLVDRVSGYTTDWISVNQPFGVQFSFYTPAGYMNPTTEISCPVDLWGEVNSYPEITWKAEAASVNRCVIEYEYTTLNVSVLAYPFFCSVLIPNWCVLTWEDKEYSKYITQVPITASWTASGAWNSGYKVLDENSKLLYVSTNLKCTLPANLTFAVQYFDNNSCTNSYFTTKLFNVSTGINPYNLTECDYDSGECYNGTAVDPAPAVPYFCSLYPTDPSCLNSTAPPLISPDTGAGGAGVTDPFNIDQSGNIWQGLLSPAFIGVVICLILGLMGAIYGGQLIGAMGFIGAFFFMTWWGLFPLWVGLGVIALSSFVTVYMIKDIFVGGQ